jgi:hypothetical protein
MTFPNAPHGPEHMDMGPTLSPEQLRQQRRGQTHWQLAQLAYGLPGGLEQAVEHAGQTVRSWIESRRPMLAGIKASSEGLRKQLEANRQIDARDPARVERGITHECIGILRTLERQCAVRAVDGQSGDPIAVMRLVRNLQGNGTITRLEQSIPALPPEHQGAVTETLRLLHDALAAMGDPHPAVNTAPLPRGVAESVAKREGQMLRMTGSVIGGIGLAISGFMALKGGASPTASAIYLGMLGLSLGWGDLTRSGTERFQDQLSWLTQTPGGRTTGLEDLRGRGYTIAGGAWATYVQALYSDEGRRLVNNTIHYGRDFSPENGRTPERRVKFAAQNRDGLIALAPPTIRDQVIRMFQSQDTSTQSGVENGAVDARDFRILYSLLQRARTPEARRYVIEYIGTGASLASALH